MNFDASQIFMAVIKQNRISWGNQLLGVLFFFVPRSIWPTKPVGSGHYLVLQNSGSYTNVSMPFFSEGYINFGYVGMLAFVIIAALIAKKFDTRYWSSPNRPSLQHGIYFLLIGASMFIMRGDLMSSFAYTMGISVTYLTTARLIQRKQ